MPGASLDPDQKVRIALALAEAGVGSIDAGFPASSPAEIEAVQRIVRQVKGPSVSVLCRTVRTDIDRAWEALAEARPDKCSVSLFIGTSPLHREHKLRKEVPELLDIVRDTIEYARRRFAIVAFSPEDASRTEPEVLHEFYRVAIDAGARVIGFPDTVGVMAPAAVRRAIRGIFEHVPNIAKAHVAAHFHNDLGLATANTLAALEAGAVIAQCAVNGIGERAGNTSMEEVAMAIAMSDDLGLRTDIKLDTLWALSQLVARETGIPLPANKPIVGKNVFETEAGIHQDGLLKHPDTYLPFRPERIGGPDVRLVLGRHSGRAAFEARLVEYGHHLDDRTLQKVVELAKQEPKSAWADERGLLDRVVALARQP
jgi:2-isopropylmalate synthase